LQLEEQNIITIPLHTQNKLSRENYN